MAWGGGGVIRQDGEGKLRCAGDSGYPGYHISADLKLIMILPMFSA